MILTEWRRRRIIREEYKRMLEEGFRAEVRRQMQEQLTIGESCKAVNRWQPIQIAGLSIVPVLIVLSEAMLLLK
jgi:hypothetical protein